MSGGAFAFFLSFTITSAYVSVFDRFVVLSFEERAIYSYIFYIEQSSTYTLVTHIESWVGGGSERCSRHAHPFTFMIVVLRKGKYKPAGRHYAL
jgi:hypothetical protein